MTSFMKQLLILNFLFLTTIAFSQDCIGDYILRSQSDVDNFPSDCTVVTGNFFIEDNFSNSITNLNGLSNLFSVGGDLRIQNNNSLTSLEGLDQIETVGGFISFYNNPLLSSLSEIKSITSLGGGISVRVNDKLTSLEGLENINSANFLIVEHNPLLISLEPLNITFVNGALRITDNINLKSLGGLDKIDKVDGVLDIRSNPQLNMCDQICPLLDPGVVTGTITILGNLGACATKDNLMASCSSAPCLVDYNLTSQSEVNDFPTDCTAIPNNLKISGADITDLTALSQVTSVGGYVDIRSNGNLTSLEGLSGLTSITGVLNIFNNPELVSVTDLRNIESVGGFLSFTDNPKLASLNGLGKLASVGGILYIQRNNILTSLTGLGNIQSVEGMVIISNPLLASLQGLQGVISIGGNLEITSNPLLDTCYSICPLLLTKAVTGTTTIFGNSGNCFSGDVLGFSCKGEDVLCPTTTDYMISTQSELDNFIATNQCNQIQGDLTISGNDITNLEGLFNINDVGGTLLIQSNPNLTSLVGLEGITSVGGNLWIFANGELTSLNGLGNIDSVGGDLQILGNIRTPSLQGLENLVSVGGDFIIQATGLTSFVGLESLSSVSGALSIIQSQDLVSLKGLEGLTSLGGDLSIIGNAVLTSLDGIQNIASVGDYVDIRDNGELTSLNGLENLTSVGGTFLIQSNPNLTSLDGLGRLASVGGTLEIQNNTSLVSASLDLTGQTSPLSSIRIDNNAVLEIATISGVTATPVESESNFISIQNNGANLSAEQSLMVSFPDFESAYGIIVLNNNEMTTLDFPNLTNIANELSIRNNSSLAVCDSFCPALQDNIPTITISGNAGGCADRTALDNTCGALSTPDESLTNFIVYPNPITSGLISFSEPVKEVVVIGSLGQVLSVDSTQISDKSIDLSALENASYILKITDTKGNTYTEQVILQK